MDAAALTKERVRHGAADDAGADDDDIRVHGSPKVAGSQGSQSLVEEIRFLRFLEFQSPVVGYHEI